MTENTLQAPACATAEPSPAPAAPAVEPYTPPVSDIVNDPLKMLERQLEAEQRNLEAISATPPGKPVPGTGPAVSIGLDAEWVHDPVTRANRILSIQFHVVGECGEFSHIEYLEADRA